MKLLIRFARYLVEVFVIATGVAAFVLATNHDSEAFYYPLIGYVPNIGLPIMAVLVLVVAYLGFCTHRWLTRKLR